MIYINVQKYSLSTSKRRLQGKGLSWNKGNWNEAGATAQPQPGWGGCSLQHSPCQVLHHHLSDGHVLLPPLSIQGIFFSPLKRVQSFVFYIQQFLIKILPKQKSSIFYHCSSTSNMYFLLWPLFEIVSFTTGFQ